MLNKKKSLIYFLILPVFFTGCNLFGESRDIELVEIRMGKTVDSAGVVSNLTDTFSPTDDKVVLWLSWNRVRGENNGVIEWHDPDGKVYMEDEFKFTAGDDTWATWHELPIARTNASLKLGDWMVYITLRGNYMDKKKFRITSTSSGDI
ncbi:MAG: hypothetical protein AB1498_03805 [bacterium]